jgi:hypothetical protein
MKVSSSTSGLQPSDTAEDPSKYIQWHHMFAKLRLSQSKYYCWHDPTLSPILTEAHCHHFNHKFLRGLRFLVFIQRKRLGEVNFTKDE